MVACEGSILSVVTKLVFVDEKAGISERSVRFRPQIRSLEEYMKDSNPRRVEGGKLRAGVVIPLRPEFAEGFVITSEDPEFKEFAMWEWCRHCACRRAKVRYESLYSCLRCWNWMESEQKTVLRGES